MNPIQSLVRLLEQGRDALLTPGVAWQVAIIILSLLTARFVHRRWKRHITERLGATEQPGIRRFTLRGSSRVVFPLSMLLVVFAGQGILSQIGYDTLILRLLTPLLLSLAVIRVAVYTLRRAFSPGPALRAWEGVISTLAWSVVALYLLGWLPDLLQAMDKLRLNVGSNSISLLDTLNFLLTTAVLLILARWLSRAIEQRARHANYFSPSMRVGLIKTSTVLLYTVAILVSLHTVGIDLTTLTVFGGALGVGIGFGLQRIASNFISGFILLFDHSIKPGDVITIGDRFGWVLELQARYIVVRDRDGVERLIPNENLITSEVINWSYSDRHVRLRLPLQISYNDDPEQAMGIMLEAAKTTPRVLDRPEPQARLMAFGDNGIELELRIWIDDPQNGVANVRSDIYLAIWHGFKKQGITIPYPQRDVHLLSPESVPPPDSK